MWLPTARFSEEDKKNRKEERQRASLAAFLFRKHLCGRIFDEEDNSVSLCSSRLLSLKNRVTIKKTQCSYLIIPPSFYQEDNIHRTNGLLCIYRTGREEYYRSWPYVPTSSWHRLKKNKKRARKRLTDKDGEFNNVVLSGGIGGFKGTENRLFFASYVCLCNIYPLCAFVVTLYKSPQRKKENMREKAWGITGSGGH